MVSKEDFVTNPETGDRSMKRDMLRKTWIFAMAVVTAMIISFLWEPTDLKVQAFTGVAMLLGTVFSIAYAGMLIGEHNNIRQATLQPPEFKPPTVPSPPTPDE